MTAVPERPRRPARTLFFGSGAFAVPALEALVGDSDVELVGIVSVPDRPVGRRHEPAAVPVVARARELGLPLLQPRGIRDAATRDEIAALRPEVGVLADYGRIVPPAVLDVPAHGILNIHPSLLPRHRGASPIPATILAGDTQTGVTIIRMDEGLDTGPIVAMESWPLDGTETAETLEARAAEAGAALLTRTLGRWLAGEIEVQAQDETAATTTRPLRREDGRLDADAPVVELERRVRALQPWPGTWVETVAGRVAIWRAEAVPGWIGSEEVEPGRFGRFGLHARDGYLALREVQPAGGRRMTFDELVRGRPGIVGSSVIPAGSG
ncbi:MAG: methionyl-tRNA formyltransferase [Chloroflexota bacterium]